MKQLFPLSWLCAGAVWQAGHRVGRERGQSVQTLCGGTLPSAAAGQRGPEPHDKLTAEQGQDLVFRPLLLPFANCWGLLP